MMKKMKRITISAIAFIVLTTASYAQKPGHLHPEQKRKLEALKVAFLTDELSLTAKEAQSFWPVYNEMDESLKKIRDERKEILRNTHKDFDILSDQELENAITETLSLTQQELDIKQSYLTQFKDILSMRKVAKLYAAEDKFKRQLLHRMGKKGR